MSFSWDEFHSDCRHVCNASIICEDGVIFTHKLILANMSGLMADILRYIPAADAVTLYLTTFSKLKVKTFLSDVLLNKDCSEPELCSIFGIKNQACHIKNDTAVEIGFRKKETQIDRVKEEVKEESLLEDDTFDQVEPDIVLREKNESVKCEQELLEKFDCETEEKIKNFEREFIENPKTKSEIISNQKTEKKIKYERAVALFKSGKVNSYKGAAKIYGVNDKTLKTILLSGGSFRGRGHKTLTRFTREEEKIIVDRALKLKSSEGKDLTYKLLIDIALEEAEVVKINQPERSDQMEFSKSQIYNFVVYLATKNHITHLVNSHIKKDIDQRRIYECEVCYRSFTYQNSVASHKRKCHSFLFSRS